MFPDFASCGNIDDIGLGLHWDARRLALEASRRAAILAQRGVGPGCVVAISHSGSAHFFADLFAVWAVGAAAACLDSTLTSPELQTVIGFVKPAALLINQSNISCTPAVPILELATSGPVEPWAGSNPDPDRPALILFTSGTTGCPKGVVLTYRALRTRIELNIAAIGAAALKRTLVTLPTHFGHGLIGNALTALLSGGDIVLYAPEALVEDQLGRIVDQHAISFLSSVPAFWNLVGRSSKPPTGDSLIRVHVGSAPLSAKLWLEVATWSRAEVVNCYGMTETANWIAGASSRTDGIADGLVGKTWGGTAAVIDDRGAFQQTGEGEIIVRSPCLMSGYFNRPDVTADVLSNGWFRTGDRGFIDDLGRLSLTGRIKDEINRAGFKVQPAEIDMVIETHPEVAEACAFAIPDPIGGEAIGAAVRLVPHATADTGSLQAWCRERVRRAAVPERWFIVESIPRNARGKINRDAVRLRLLAAVDTPKPGINGRQPRSAASPAGGERKYSDSMKSPSQTSGANRVQVAVERAWTRVLNRRSFRANTPWNLAGGDSLGAMRLWLEIEQQLATQLPLDRLAFDMTPSELICAIEKLLEPADERPRLVHVRRQQPLVFLMPSAIGDIPPLAQFRAALDGVIRFEVIQYPKLNELIDGSADFNMIVDAAVAQILAKCGEEPCYLAGYSFGGLVAWESARRLLEAGSRVDFLGLIDSRLVNRPRERESVFLKAGQYIGRAWRHPKQAYHDGLLWLSDLSVRKCPLWLLQRIDRLLSPLQLSFAYTFRLYLELSLRADILRGRAVGTLDVPVTLFRSNEWSTDAPDHGWGALCKRLVVLPVGGDHYSLLESTFRETLCARFQQAVETARAFRRTEELQPVIPASHFATARIGEHRLSR
jgi:acyl-CoA synthetase (AMP-forming)/AMP-acid ligase II/thioesterase domain-containing protein